MLKYLPALEMYDFRVANPLLKYDFEGKTPRTTRKVRPKSFNTELFYLR